MFLNWFNDPLLLDQQSVSSNKWITANKLIETNQQEKIFLNQEQLILNLFPILVRRCDFIRESSSDRILARFPFKVLSEEEKTTIADKDLLIAEVARDYFYRSINNGVLDWRIAIKNYLERGAMPYPLLRCSWEVCPPPDQGYSPFLSFENAKGKAYRVPRLLNKQLAYFCGVCNGDGHLNEHWLRIVDETRAHIEFLSRLCKELFADAGRVFLTGNAWNVELRVSAAVRLMYFLTDQSINQPKYDALREPLLFKHLGDDFRRAYWRGAMDADGSFKGHISFISASSRYVKDLQMFLNENGIPSKTREHNQSGAYLFLSADNFMNYAKLVGVLNPKKKRDFFKLLNRARTPSRFKGIKGETLTSEGYFNFSLIPEIQIVGLDRFLTTLRNNRYYKTMREALSLSEGSYPHYESGSRSAPISLLEKIISIEYSSTKSLMQLLDELSPSILYLSATSDTINLPLKPSTSLLQLLSYLDPKANYTSIHTEDEKVLSSLTKTFNTLFKPPRISNRLITRYLKTFFEYEKQEYAVPMEQFKSMEKEWREGIVNGPFL